MADKSIKVITNSAKETQDLAKKLAKDFLAKKRPIVLALEGELGGGKTTFLQGFAKGLGVKEKILSPTFNIFKKFKIKDKYFYHFDCYRIEDPKEILNLGFKEIISNSNNIIAIEWASKIKKILPKNTIHLKFKFTDENTRSIDIAL